MSEELKPCPFCGGEAERITLQDQDNFGGDVISCKKCECCTRVLFGEKEGLAESWNKRAELAALKAGQGEAVPYAYEYGKDNGDGSYSVTITRGQIPSYLTPVKDWPIKPLYTAPPAPAGARLVPVELLEHSAQFIERHSFFQFGDPVTPDAAVGRSLSDQLRALLAQSESKGMNHE